MKVARFSEVVKKSGKPTVHLTWTKLGNDTALQNAIKTSRLMTVHQNLHGGAKDNATIGFQPGHNTQFLIFPKSLKRFVGLKIVGINYDLFASNPQPRAHILTKVTRSRTRPTTPIENPPRPMRFLKTKAKPPSDDGAFIRNGLKATLAALRMGRIDRAINEVELLLGRVR